MTVDTKPATLRRSGNVKLGSFPKNIAFSFGPRTNASPPPLRIRYWLEGYDSNWRDGAGEFFFTVRFFNQQGDQVNQTIYRANGSSAGWTGSLKSSPLTHRREAVVVPEGASRLWVVLSSAGPPAAVGVYVVANLVVSRSSGNSPPVVLMQSPLDHEVDGGTNQTPSGWTRDGNHSSMARIVTLSESPIQRAFAIFDDDASSHAEWHNIMESAPAVKPGEQILVEWNEMFSIGVGEATTANYPRLSQGNYRFRAAATDILGVPTGLEDSVSVSVTPPLWSLLWFWALVATAAGALAAGASRYFAWHRMRREMARLKNQQALEQERLRIAQDIHDDLGARVTEISLASALAKKKPALPDSVVADFDRISNMSRDLVSALYETVWAVNPENDNLDALGNYLCQISNQLCQQAQLPCRLRVSDLPTDIEVSSQTRHNVIMAVKEALHNAIKHAKATELTLHVRFENGVLAISVQDNGCGFDIAGAAGGNGLTNMKRRLAGLDGSCDIESRAGQGTTVQMRLALKTASRSVADAR